MNQKSMHLLSQSFTPKGIIALLFISIFASNNTVFAVTLKIIDQNGKAVEHVVVSAPTTMPADLPKSMVMDQIDKQFQPHVLVVNKGQDVIFPNSDDIRHHIYSFSKPKPFEIKMYKGGDSKSLEFSEPGIVVLGCNIHDQMLGYIYIAENETTGISNKLGQVTLDTNSKKIHLWHSQLSANHIERKSIEIKQGTSEVQIVSIDLHSAKVPQIQRKFSSKKFNKKD